MRRSVRDFLFNLFPPGGLLRRGVEALLPVADVLLLPFTLAGHETLGDRAQRRRVA